MTPSRLQQRWDALARRERALLLLGTGVVSLALLWLVALAPALGVLRSSEVQQAALDSQLQQIQGLQAQARALQAQPRMSYDDALRALDASVKQRLGAGAQLSIAGDRARVTFKGVSAETLAQWLIQARIGARAVPAEAHLSRATTGPAAAAAVWDGSLVLNLPAR